MGRRQGSLIPVNGEDGETAFVKDSAGQVVKSKLDDKRLREIAQAAGGFYLHLENGPRTMQQIYTEGLAKMQAAEMDVRLSRRPIERYEWPLGAALIALALSILIGERKRSAKEFTLALASKNRNCSGSIMDRSLSVRFRRGPGAGRISRRQIRRCLQPVSANLKTHPQSRAEDKLQFDSGAAAYKSQEYGKALESFSQALLSPDTGLQEQEPL